MSECPSVGCYEKSTITSSPAISERGYFVRKGTEEYLVPSHQFDVSQLTRHLELESRIILYEGRERILDSNDQVMITYLPIPENELIEFRKKLADPNSKILAQDIGELDLSVRAYTRLQGIGIKTIRDLLNFINTPEKFATIPGFGKNCVREVRKQLYHLGFQLEEMETSFDALKARYKKNKSS